MSIKLVRPTNMKKRFAQSADFRELAKQRESAKQALLRRARAGQGRRKTSTATEAAPQTFAALAQLLAAKSE